MKCWFLTIQLSYRSRRIFTSSARAKALQQCGWSTYSHISNIDLDLASFEFTASKVNSRSASFDQNMPCQEFVDFNVTENSFTRNAAVMVFNGRIVDAINCLEKASDLNSNSKSGSSEDSASLNAIAIALSAYVTSSKNIENDKVWFKTCQNLKFKFKDPYVKAIFGFLSMESYEDENYIDLIVSIRIFRFRMLTKVIKTGRSRSSGCRSSCFCVHVPQRWRGKFFNRFYFHSNKLFKLLYIAHQVHIFNQTNNV